VSSASVDVRSSPALGKVDVVTSASGNTSTTGGKMFDRRLAGTLGLGWKDGKGHGWNLSATYANERDYNSVGTGLNGSYDLLNRALTLLAGVSFTYNWIASFLDPTFARQSYQVAWTAGLAPVLSRSDALRLRYDGAAVVGYQASPYRNVRFGNWTTNVDRYGTITFANTTGSADGLPEVVPEKRIRHALVLDWVHAFTTRVALHLEVRGGLDDWGVKSVAPAIELRWMTDRWRGRLGYRFYMQSGADFYQSKYVLASSSYTYFTSDKELSQEIGHAAHVGISRVLKEPKRAGELRALVDLSVDYLHYAYPDFVLLPSRDSGVVELGLTFER
jgi:hypothetical protein